MTELDVARLFGSPDYEVVIAELRPGELRAAADAHGTAADPANRDADRLWWNWCRTPAALSAAVREPASVAVIPASSRISAPCWIATSPVSRPECTRATR